MSYFISYKKINDRYYFKNLFERTYKDDNDNDIYDADSEILISETIYLYIAKSFNLYNVFNHGQTSRYYSLSTTIEKEDDILKDESVITNTEELNMLKKYYNFYFEKNILYNTIKKFPILLYDFVMSNQLLLEKNYVITDENRDAKISEILEKNDEDLSDKMVDFFSKREELMDIVNISKKYIEFTEKLETATTSTEIDEYVSELSNLIDY